MSAAGGPGRSGSGDRLAELAGRLAALDAEPVAEHPQVLEEVHRGLVGELDALAGVSHRSQRP